MKWKNKWINILFFLLGCLVCYLTTQISLFKIEDEINVPELIISLGTAVIGIYIANTIQRNINKNQNKYAYVETKLDFIWTAFNDFSQLIIYSDNIDLTAINNLNRNILHPISFLKNIFKSFDIESVDNITSLEQKIETLENFLSNLPATQNVINISTDKARLETNVIEINQCFSQILKQIQDL